MPAESARAELCGPKPPPAYRVRRGTAAADGSAFRLSKRSCAAQFCRAERNGRNRRGCVEARRRRGGRGDGDTAWEARLCGLRLCRKGSGGDASTMYYRLLARRLVRRGVQRSDDDDLIIIINRNY
eukprot:9565-Pyramimonas_sp.AAC.1